MFKYIDKDFEDINRRFIFISDGTWFKKGTEVECEDLWFDEAISFNVKSNDFINLDLTTVDKTKYTGVFIGIFGPNEYNKNHYHQNGDIDGEICPLSEFEIRKRN